jgi:hypothetical protein
MSMRMPAARTIASKARRARWRVRRDEYDGGEYDGGEYDGNAENDDE